jgi:hypothetical protein
VQQVKGSPAANHGPEFMSEPDLDHSEPVPLGKVLESANGFGLAPEEIWQAIGEALERLPDDAKAAFVDELTRELTTRLLEKERSY